MTTKETALNLIREGESMKIISERTGVSTGTLRSWKKRHVSEPKAKAVPKAAKKNSTTKRGTSKAVAQIEQMPQPFTHKLEVLQADSQIESSEPNATTDPNDIINDAPNDLPLIAAVLALHVSAIYGVGEILSSVFHTVVMGYLTSIVFVCAGLIMFVSKRFSYGVSWLVLVATFVLESYCNYLTIHLNMTAEKMAAFELYTNTGVLFFCIFVFVPLVNLALEYLLFSSKR